jgi:hypothetical protein
MKTIHVNINSNDRDEPEYLDVYSDNNEIVNSNIDNST